MVMVNGAAAADIKFAYTWPGTATAIWGLQGLDTGGAAYTNGTQTASAGTLALATTGAGVNMIYYISGEIDMGATPGTLQMQAAQNTSDLTAPVLRLVKQRIWREA